MLDPATCRLGLIAGGGALPWVILAGARGQNTVTARLHDFASAPDTDGLVEDFKMGELGAIIDFFKRHDVEAVSFAGHVKRPDFTHFPMDEEGNKSLAALKSAAQGGDDNLLRQVVRIFENAGFHIFGTADIAPHLLAGAGQIGSIRVPDEAKADMARALDVARLIGQADIGQGAVVCNGVVLAVEAQEGTDAMLARCARLPQDLRGSAQARRGVFAKLAKPGQDRRIDLPTIGLSTLKHVRDAGLAGIAMHADASLLLERAAVIAEANRHGIFLFGYTDDV